MQKEVVQEVLASKCNSNDAEEQRYFGNRQNIQLVNVITNIVNPLTNKVENFVSYEKTEKNSLGITLITSSIFEIKNDILYVEVHEAKLWHTTGGNKLSEKVKEYYIPYENVSEIVVERKEK